MKPKILTDYDIKIDGLPENLDLPLEQLKKVSKGLQAIYAVHCHDPQTGSVRNHFLVLRLIKAVYRKRKDFALRFHVWSSVANKQCKIDICTLFENTKINEIKHLEI